MEKGRKMKRIKIKNIPRITFIWVGYIVTHEVARLMTAKPGTSFEFITNAKISFSKKD